MLENVRGPEPLDRTSRSRPAPAEGLTALLAACSWIAWIVINASTRGALDTGWPAVSERLDVVGRVLMVSWNVLLVPAAFALHTRLVAVRPRRMRAATACGVSALLLWAYGGATHTISRPLEVTYLALGGFWWCGLGITLRRGPKWFANLTTVLGVIAIWDAILTSLEPLPLILYVTAAPKLPLSIAWDFSLGYLLCRRSIPATANAALLGDADSV
ncbi:MAG: hypothetical protein NVS4B3_07540 [Gemmatimonadaceae bacterium]